MPSKEIERRSNHGGGRNVGLSNWEARKLELRDERVPIPEVFIKAFARTLG